MASEINDTEMYFEWWLEELKKLGLVLEYEREPQTFVLEQALPIFYSQHYKRKDALMKNFNLFQPITYTPDYRVVFSGKMVDKLIGVICDGLLRDDIRMDQPGNVYQQVLFYYYQHKDYFNDNPKTKEQIQASQFEVFFDVKPPAKALRFSGRLGSSREFPIKQRLMYEKHNIIVNKVIPVGSKNCLFAKTFMPRRYKWTNKSGALRKLKDYESKARSIDQYLKEKEINV